MNPVKVGVIGCGSISDIYFTNMIHTFSTTEVVACSANHIESAQKKAAQYGIRTCKRPAPFEGDELFAKSDN